jgi:ELWxxDGT repeat protein
VGNRVFFRANDGSGGFELWQSDGTATSRVADITPGPDGSYPQQLVRVGDDLFFSARDAGSNVELWRFDGTAVQRVADINPGPEGSYPQWLTAVGSTLFFSATDGSSGYELWTSDGSAAGTVRVADIVPGSGSAGIANLTPIGGRLLFSASDDSSGNELWTTDGVVTSRVADISAGESGSYPDHLTVVNDVVYFQANNGSDGVELWQLIDSTVSRVANIRPGKFGSYPSHLKAVGNVLYFSADDGSSGEELWAVDGRPTLAIAASSASRAEGNSGSTPFSFTISRSGDTSAASSVDYSVTGSGSSRASASDFTANAFPSGTVNFAPGQTAATIKIQVRGDLEVEANEGFAVSLSNAVTAKIRTAVAVGLIRNDDVPPPPPQLAIAASSASRAEGNSGSTPFSFIISRSGDTSAASRVDYSVSTSGRGRASAGDFTANAFPSGTVSFAAEQTSATITIQVRGDRDVESNESFAVSLRNAGNATIGTSFATGLILNDDFRSRSSRARRDRLDGLTGLTGSSENLMRTKAAPAVTNPSALADTQLSHLRSGGWAADAGARAPFLLGATGAADLLQVITPLL